MCTRPAIGLTVRGLLSEVTGRLRSPIGRNMGWLAAEQVFTVAVSGTVSIIVVRYLGPTRFGSYAFASALVGIVGSFAQLNGPLVVRDIVIDPERERQTLMSAALLTASIVMVAEAVLVAVGLLAVGDPTTRKVLFVLALGLLVRPVMVLDFAFQAHLRARPATAARNTGRVLSAVAVVLIVANHGGLTLIAGATLVSSLVVAALLVRFYIASNARAKWRTSMARTSSLARRSFPLVVAAIAIGVYMSIDEAMLGWMSTRHEVGIYAATVRISEFAYFLPMIFVSSVGPSIARARATDLQRYRDQILSVFSYLSAASLTIAVATQFVGGSLAKLLYGAEYAGVGPILAVHIFACVFVFLGVGETLWTVNESLEALAMYRTIAGAVLNVLLNVVLIPRYGALGSAWATLAAYAVATTIGNAFHASTRPVFWMQLRSLNPTSWAAAVRADLA